MLRIFTIAALAALIAAPAQARPGLGLKVKKVGDNFIIQDPVIKQHLEPEPPAKQSIPLPGKLTISPLMQPDSVDGFSEANSLRITRQFRPGDAVIAHFGTGSGAFDIVPVERPVYRSGNNPKDVPPAIEHMLRGGGGHYRPTTGLEAIALSRGSITVRLSPGRTSHFPSSSLSR